MPDVTPKPLRSQANGIINLMGALGAVFSLVLISLLVPKEGTPDYFKIFAIVAGFMVFAVAVLFTTIKENKIAKEMKALEEPTEETEEPQVHGSTRMEPAVRRSFWLILASIFFWFFAYNAVTTAFSKYVQSYLGVAGGGFANSLMIATAAVLAFVPAGMIVAGLAASAPF